MCTSDRGIGTIQPSTRPSIRPSVHLKYGAAQFWRVHIPPSELGTVYARAPSGIYLPRRVWTSKLGLSARPPPARSLLTRAAAENTQRDREGKEGGGKSRESTDDRSCLLEPPTSSHEGVRMLRM
jgi:hypothetical protein